MKLTHEAICVQKNASQLINEVLWFLSSEPEAFKGYEATTESLRLLYLDEKVWDPILWGGEDSMNDARNDIRFAIELFRLNDIIEAELYENGFK